MNEALSKPAKQRPILFKLITLVCVLAIVGVSFYIDARRNLIIIRKPTTLVTATAIESAVNNFYTEYGAMPDVGSRVTTDSPEGVKLLTIMLGLENTDKPQNTRGIKFLSVKEGKDRRNGLIYATEGNRPEGLFDKWGNPYTVELDADYNEQLHFTVASKAVDLEGRRVTAYSPGADKKLGTVDDVKNW